MAITAGSRDAYLLRVTKDTAYAPKPFFDLPNVVRESIDHQWLNSSAIAPTI